MAGLNFIQYFSAIKPAPGEIYDRAASTLMRLPGDAEQVHVRTDTMALGSKTYAAYPGKWLETPAFRLMLEGRIYNAETWELEKALPAVAEDVFSATGGGAFAQRWQADADGDFIFWMNEKKTGKTAVVNDVFGRLPLYYQVDAQRVVLARDIQFLYALRRQLTVDRLSLAHFLMLGHALGDRTIWNDINILTPGSLLCIDPLKKQVAVQRLATLSFDSPLRGSAGGDRNAHDLADVFIPVCRSRAGRESPTVVSLSGGVDSRAAAAGLQAAGVTFTTATFRRPGYTSVDEIICARQVARQLKVPWDVIDLPDTSCGDAYDLLRLKAGFSPLYMAFIESFFRELQHRYGRACHYLTGDGGDQCLPMLLPPAPVPMMRRSMRGLAKYIIDDNYLGGRRLGLTATASLTGIRERDLVDSLMAYLETIPETTMEGRWLHYNFYGITVKIYFEAEDRNRCHFWSASPFYSQPFYRAAIACPQSHKSFYRLYGKFLGRLSPELFRLPVSGYGASLGSARFRMHHMATRVKFIMPRHTLQLKHWLKGANALPPDARVLLMMQKMTAGCAEISDCLRPGRIMHIIRYHHRYDQYHVLLLFTALAMLEWGLRGESTVAQYGDMRLI